MIQREDNVSEIAEADMSQRGTNRIVVEGSYGSRLEFLGIRLLKAVVSCRRPQQSCFVSDAEWEDPSTMTFEVPVLLYNSLFLDSLLKSARETLY
eukprot:IDg13106t1